MFTFKQKRRRKGSKPNDNKIIITKKNVGNTNAVLTDMICICTL
jgi:hypothetical protein